MTRRLFLHAGQPKTGTTAVQKFCAQHREGLLALGYLYPAAGKSRGNHKFLVQALLGKPAKPTHATAPYRLLVEMEEHPAPNVMLSSEYLFAHLAAKREESPLLQFFRERGFTITIAIFIRPDAELVNSEYVQANKSFRGADAIEAFARRHATRAIKRYGELIRLMQAPDLETQFFPYTQATRRTGIVQSFLAVAGIGQDDAASLGPERRINRSIGPIGLAVARDTLARLAADGRVLSIPRRSALNDALASLIEIEPAEPPYQGVDRALHDEIEALVSPERERFAMRAWGRSWAAVFQPQCPPPCNDFDPSTAAAAEQDRFRRMRDALWKRAEEILR